MYIYTHCRSLSKGPADPEESPDPLPAWVLPVMTIVSSSGGDKSTRKYDYPC